MHLKGEDLKVPCDTHFQNVIVHPLQPCMTTYQKSPAIYLQKTAFCSLL